MDDVILKKIRAAAKKVAGIDARRAEAMAERDSLMLEARDAGKTWTQIQEAAMMQSPAAVSSALRRATSSTSSETTKAE